MAKTTPLNKAQKKSLVRCLKVDIKNLDSKRKELRDKGWLSHEYKIKREENTAFIPLRKEAHVSGSKGTRLVSKLMTPVQKVLDYREQLAKILSTEEQAYAPHAFDLIGDICLLRLDERLVSKPKTTQKIGAIFLNCIPSIHAVYTRTGEYEGELRTQKVQYLAGRCSTETMHHENGIKLLLDIEKVYFSVRSATERMRIANQVVAGEKIIIMFSGCSPYECCLGKNSPAAKIVGIELNQIAHQYGLVNCALNKLEEKVTLYCGDVRRIVPQMQKQKGGTKRGAEMVRFDRIIMPLPRTAENFLDLIPLIAKKGTTIHLYQFGEWGSTAILKKKCHTIIAEHLPHMKFRINQIASCGQFSPRVYRICVDFVITSSEKK